MFLALNKHKVEAIKAINYTKTQEIIELQTLFKGIEVLIKDKEIKMPEKTTQ